KLLRQPVGKQSGESADLHDRDGPPSQHDHAGTLLVTPPPIPKILLWRDRSRRERFSARGVAATFQLVLRAVASEIIDLSERLRRRPSCPCLRGPRHGSDRRNVRRSPGP